jgi:hypothetical protein
VRAVVADPSDRAAFDTWYRREHLPDAIRAFSASAAWRAWSSADPSIHRAYYRFESFERLDKLMSRPVIQTLVAEFDRGWSGHVTRTREVLAIADEFDERQAGRPGHRGNICSIDQVHQVTVNGVE